MENYDWQKYISDHPDLIKSGLCTDEDAKRHWLNHGKKEQRKIYKKTEKMLLADKKIAIAIMSCKKNRKTRQQLVKDTWLNSLDNKIWFFFEGGDETVYNKEDNILTVECPDTYIDLALKTKLMIEYVSKNFDIDYLIKVDDDTCVIPHNLLHTPVPKEDYVGYPVGNKETNIKYGQGGGYILSKKSLDVISKYKFNKGKESCWWYGGQKNNNGWNLDKEIKKNASVEDLMVGTILHEHGITITELPEFYDTNFNIDRALKNSGFGIFYHPVIDRHLMSAFVSTNKQKAILIVTVGRTGSTLLQGILNTIDNSLITGENFGIFINYWKAYKSFNETIIESKKNKHNDTRSAWYNPQLDRQKFVCSLRTSALSMLDPNNTYDVIGFKEIRYDKDFIERQDLKEYLDFLQYVLFQNTYVIFLTRDSEDVIKSRNKLKNSFKESDINNLESLNSFFNCITNLSGNRRFIIDYSDLTVNNSKIKELFDFIDEEFNEDLINKVLNKKHSY
jgi:hypothetical protein